MKYISKYVNKGERNTPESVTDCVTISGSPGRQLSRVYQERDITR